MSRSFRINGAAALAAVAFTTACAQPPQDAIDLAAQAEAAATEAGVAEYAPEAMSAVMEAKAALDAELAVQGEKMAMTRSYRQAEELAAAYQAAAEQAASAATEARQKAEEEATLMIADSRMALEESRTLLASAPRGKGSAADLAAMGTDLDAAATLLTEAEAALQAGDFLQARTKATTALDAINRVRDAVTQALTIGR